MATKHSSSDGTTKVCLLTGASGTIGHAIARALKASSTPWHVVVIGRRPPPPPPAGAGGEPPAAPPHDEFLRADLTDEPSVRSALDRHFGSLRTSPDPTARSLDRLDLLVNCAGCSLGNEPIASVSADVFRSVMEVNLVAPYILSRWAMSKMATPEGGRIINVGSVAEESPRLHSVPYMTSKRALSGLTRALSMEGRHLAATTMDPGAGRGVVAVCQVNPGNVRSDMIPPDEAARREREEGFVEADDVGRFVALVAELPVEANVLESMVMPTRMPLVGRG